MNELRLTNGNETFLVSQIIYDNLGPVSAKDNNGNEYFRCEYGDSHEYAPDGSKVWHDLEYTEELWEVL